MNKSARSTIFIILITITPGSLCVGSSVSTETIVPWNSTFSGINAPPVAPQSLANTGPFQQSPIPAPVTTPVSDNPFATSANALSEQTTQATAQSISQILTSIYTPLSQKVNAMFTSDTSMGGSPLKVGPRSKYRIPTAAQAIGNLNNVSFTQGQRTILTPPQPLFPDNQELAQAYENFMGALKATPSFFPLFRKVHIVALHQIYMYLVGIYTALNMTHIDDLKSYMVTEKQYALNKKTLIVNHLVNVVMAQLGQAIRSLLPGLAESSAISTGMRCIQSDQMSDPNIFILDIEKSVLAVLGLEQLDTSLTSLAYLGIRKYMPVLGITETPDLTAALTLLTSTNFSVKNLTPPQARALSQTIYSILAYITAQATTANVDALVSYLTNPETATPSSDQTQLLGSLVTQFSLGEPLTRYISLAQNYAQLLQETTPSATPLTAEERQGLKSILAYILEQYEATTVQELAQVVEILGKLNPTYQVLTPSQALAAKDIALRMLGQPPYTTQLALENLTDTQRADLSYALWVASNNAANTTFSTAQMQLFQSIALPLKENPLSASSLTAQQATALQQALVAFSSYTLAPLTAADFGVQVQSTLTTANPSQSEQQQQNDIMQALQVIQSPSFTSFNQLTTEEQILVLQLFQTFDQVYETRLQSHRQESSSLRFLFGQNPGDTQALCSSITPSQYETLNALDAALEATTGPVSFKILTEIKAPSEKAKWMDPRTALLKLFTVPQAPSQKGVTPPSTAKPRVSTLNGTSFLNILLLIKKRQFQDKLVTNFTASLSPQNVALFQDALPIINQPNFLFNQINAPTRTALATTLTSYKTKVLSQQKAYKPNLNISDPTENALQTVAAVISSHNNFSAMRKAFLAVLKEYLTFFNLYARTLQNISNTPNNPSYVGLTQFADYAHAIRTALQYESSSNDSIAKLLEQANPPLFFYDPATFRGVRLLPKLAAEVENSSVAPYPTFGIEQTVSPNGTALDPLTGQTVTNLQSIGSFAYQKFFFLEAPDATTEVTGILPSWVKKVAVTSSKGTSYLYEPNNLPKDGITGFYMNIPIFGKDPSGAMTIRLYEQPIIAQPAWLNKSGAASGTPQAGAIPSDKAGVVTLLRGCLGDFQALLDLDIFDPCLTIIFSSALALTDDAKLQSVAQTRITSKIPTCSAYLKEKTAMLEAQQSPLAPTAASQALGTTVTTAGGGQ